MLGEVPLTDSNNNPSFELAKISNGPEMLSLKSMSFEKAVVSADISDIATVFKGLFPNPRVVLLKSTAVCDAVEQAPPLPATQRMPSEALISLNPSINSASLNL